VSVSGFSIHTLVAVKTFPYPVSGVASPNLAEGDRRPGVSSPGYALSCSGRARSPSFGMGFPLAINLSNR
jgi:hypothetical protein